MAKAGDALRVSIFRNLEIFGFQVVDQIACLSVSTKASSTTNCEETRITPETAGVLVDHQKASWVPVHRRKRPGARPTHGTRVCKLISEKCIAILTVIVGGW
jgi:hypothetical protein